MLPGRLGLDTARIPHADRHGLLYLDRGHLTVTDGCLRFTCAGGGHLASGTYAIPFQGISMVMLGPGTMVSHDALRLLARHGTGLVAVGADGVRQYSAPPLMADTSTLARQQVTLWSKPQRGRLLVARRMYAKRLGVIMPHRDIAVLRGMEGARVKTLYALLADKYRVPWQGRRYDRTNPAADDEINQAINHAASAVEGAAAIAVCATATIPQLGFIHEDSGQAFVLDVADLFREGVTLPCAFKAVSIWMRQREQPLERVVRTLVGTTMRRSGTIPGMIDAIKFVLAQEDVGAQPAEEPVDGSDAEDGDVSHNGAA